MYLSNPILLHQFENRITKTKSMCFCGPDTLDCYPPTVLRMETKNTDIIGFVCGLSTTEWQCVVCFTLGLWCAWTIYVRQMYWCTHHHHGHNHGWKVGGDHRSGVDVDPPYPFFTLPFPLYPFFIYSFFYSLHFFEMAIWPTMHESAVCN